MNKEELSQKQRYLSYLSFPMPPLHLLKEQTQIHETHLPCGQVWELIQTVLSGFILVPLESWPFSCDEEIYCLNKEQTEADS